MVFADGGDPLRSAAPAARVTANLSLAVVPGRAGGEATMAGAAFDGRFACRIVIPQATGLLAMATVTRADLARAVSEEAGLPYREARVLVDMLIEEMAARLAAGEEVKLSSFGSFNLRDKAGRTGRNPKTREAAAIVPRRVVSFRASHVLRRRIQEGLSKRADGS